MLVDRGDLCDDFEIREVPHENLSSTNRQGGARTLKSIAHLIGSLAY